MFNSVHQFFVSVGPDPAEQISTAKEQSDRLMSCCERVTEGILKPLTDICNLSFLSEILETLFNKCHDKLTAKHTLHAKSHQGFSSIRTTWTILTDPPAQWGHSKT